MSSRAWKIDRERIRLGAEELARLRKLPLTETVEIVVRADTRERAEGLRDELVKLLRQNLVAGASADAFDADGSLVAPEPGHHPLYQRLYGVLQVHVAAEPSAAAMYDDSKCSTCGYSPCMCDQQ